MALYRKNQTTINTYYIDEYNMWFANVWTGDYCVRRAMRLREGEYPIYNGLMASVDYNKKNQETQIISDATIDFISPCQQTVSTFEPCGDCL